MKLTVRRRWIYSFSLICLVAVPQGRVRAVSYAEPAETFLEGSVLNAEGLTVSAYANPSPFPPHITCRSEQGGIVVNRRAHLGTAGSFRIDGLEPGVYDLLVPRGFAAGISYQPRRIYGVEIHRGRNVLNLVGTPGMELERCGNPIALDAATLRSGRIEGRIVGPDGEAIWGTETGLVGVQIRLETKDFVSYPAPARLDANGFFEARDLPAGSYSVRVPAGFR